jgi:hypothetical protein
VVSDLAALDATVQLTDTTTEGASLAWSEVTAEWLSAHGYKLGESVDAPWVKGEQLTLWFEDELSTDLEDIFGGNCGDILGGENQTAKKMIINGQMYILRHDGLYNITGARVR